MEEPTLQPSPPREATPIPTPHTDALADTLAHGARLAGRGEALGTDLTLPPKVAVISSQTAYWIRSSFRLGRRESVVTLDPPDLGRMRISLREDGPQLTARIQTELPEVASILREGAEAIRERLESQGLRIDHLVIESVGDRAQRPATVETPQGQQAHSDLGTGAQERRGEFQRSAPSAAQATRESEVPPDPAVEETQTVAPGLHRLDLRV